MVFETRQCFFNKTYISASILIRIHTYAVLFFIVCFGGVFFSAIYLLCITFFAVKMYCLHFENSNFYNKSLNVFALGVSIYISFEHLIIIFALFLSTHSHIQYLTSIISSAKWLTKEADRKSTARERERELESCNPPNINGFADKPPELLV